jgi:hypothetical protein
MKKVTGVAFLISLFIASCGTSAPSTMEVNPAAAPPLPIHADWQIQYTGNIDLTLDADVYNLDLFDTDSADIAQLHARGIFVMCYFSAGSFEDWRPDADQFPTQVFGKNMENWAGETWLDIRQINLLKPIMESRLDLAVEKDCDGVDPDNVNGYTNNTGFPLTGEDQIKFNIFLAKAAHQRGLKIGLKNDIEQIPELLPYFDWELNEECFSFNECEMLLPFVEAGKPVFVIEYETSADEFCPRADELNFNAIQKNWGLDAFYVSCKTHD